MFEQASREPEASVISLAESHLIQHNHTNTFRGSCELPDEKWERKVFFAFLMEQM